MPETNNIYIKYKEYTVGGEPESDDRWCSYSDEHTSVTFLGFSISNNNDFTKVGWDHAESIPASIYKKAAKGVPLHLVVVRYTTGNTFGTSYGRWKIIHITDDSRKAWDVQQILEKSQGEKVPAHCNIDTYKCWVGYFERYECCEIHTIGLV